LLARPGQLPAGDEVLVGLGLGMTTTALLTLLLHYVPGRLTVAHLLCGDDVLVLCLAALVARRTFPGLARGRQPRWSRWPFVVLLLLTVALRLVNLGYSEFQGDEGVIMVRAAQALEGDDDALFMHQKGPVEILLPLATWRLSGTIDEFWARLPFAWAGILGVLAVVLLGRRLFDRRAGWLAGWLMAISGYHVAFGRIVQYQSVVLLGTAVALLALWRWSQGDRDRWLLAAAALLAFAGLCHYDAVMALPPALYLIARRLSPLRFTFDVSRPIVAAFLLGLLILSTFYLPYALSPNFGKTVGYLSGERIGSGGPLYDNLGSSFVLTTVYNSTWYVGGLILLLVGTSVTAFRGRGRFWPLALVAAALVSSALSGGAVVPFVALGLWWGSVLVARPVPPSVRMAWIWFGVPFLFFHFLVWDPRTHVLNLFPGACLVAGFALSRVYEWAKVARRGSGDHGPRVRAEWGWQVASLAVLGVMSYYPVWMFVSHTPEVQRTWPEHRHVLFTAVYDEIPPFGLFGFPHRAGWKAVGALFDAGALAGSYASNEEVEVTGWYTRGAERTFCPAPDWYLVADQVQDEIPIDRADLEAHYHLAAVVERGEDALLRLYAPGAAAAAVTHQLSDFARDFDRASTPDAVLPPPPRDHVPVGATLGDQVRLLGYRLDRSEVAPGDTIELVLYWEALTPLEKSYHVFTHLYREGEMWGQADGVPQCGLWPTLRWQPGEVVADRYWLTLRPDTPAGSIPLTVGMYTLPDGTRLPIRDAHGDPLGDALPLTTVEVSP
jgi:4-amino-4-deoxy-L-arabinose transferase-like glycosyltransferase